MISTKTRNRIHKLISSAIKLADRYKLKRSSYFYVSYWAIKILFCNWRRGMHYSDFDYDMISTENEIFIAYFSFQIV